MKQLKFLRILIIITLSLCGCGSQGGKTGNSSQDSLSAADTQIQKSKTVLPALDEGETHLTDEAFGTTINLTGQPVNIKENIKPEQLFVKDNYLITNNQRSDSVFMIFELPEMKCIASFGVRGRGPDEFGFPQIIETFEDSILFYIYDLTGEKVYKVSKKLLKPEYYLTMPNQNRGYDDKHIIFFDDKTAFYSASKAKGKMIYSFNKDSLTRDKVFINLAIPGKKGSWTTYIGDFGANRNVHRAVYAYKYFKRLKIVDMQTMKERSIIFDAEELAKGQSDIANLEPTNITHFWGMSANDEYFWMLYSGRTPVDVMRDNQNKKKYIFVEKYDWNGNPVKRFKLDDWGYFCVDKKNEILYLASTVSVYSLIKYNVAEAAY